MGNSGYGPCRHHGRLRAVTGPTAAPDPAAAEPPGGAQPGGWPEVFLRHRGGVRQKRERQKEKPRERGKRERTESGRRRAKGGREREAEGWGNHSAPLRSHL